MGGEPRFRRKVRPSSGFARRRRTVDCVGALQAPLRRCATESSPCLAFGERFRFAKADARRSGWVKGWIVICWAAIGCRGAPMEPVGMASLHGAPGTAVVEAGAAAPSPVAADFREHMTRVVGRQLSRGHGEAFDGAVWANEAANGAWATRDEMPDGAALVEELTEKVPGKGDRAAGLLFMEKKDGAWRFLAIGADGRAAEDSRCAACHSQAPRDDVFRIDQPASAASTAPMTAIAPTTVATPAATHDARSAGAADASVKP
jgi:hypothetical protein